MSEGVRQPGVTVVLAVYEPQENHLRQQIESLAAQSHQISKLIVVIADCASQNLVEECGKSGPWTLDTVMPEARTNSFRSFELGLRRAVDTSEEGSLIALCDQDDIWHANKLAVLVERQCTTGASLVHSDARIVDAEGVVKGSSLFRREKRLLSGDPRDLLLRNCVTGMTSLIDRDAALASLPFPAQSAVFFHHDLWLALVASALKGVSHVDTALVDYRQHGANVVGATGAWTKAPSFFSKAWMRHWVGSYSVATYLAKALYLRMEEVTATGGLQPNRNRLGRLAPYLNEHARGGALIVDALKYLPIHLSHSRQAAMFAAVQSARTMWALRRCFNEGYFKALDEFDRKSFAMAPGAQPTQSAKQLTKPKEVWTADQFRDVRLSRKFEISVDRLIDGRMVIFVPSLNPAEVFAGIATAIDIGLGLADRGHDIVFVATDLPIASVERTRSFILSRGAGSKDVAAQIDVFCGVTGGQLALSPADEFLATAWWTAHLADRLLKDVGRPTDPFYYLIQDYEPGFYAWGAEYTGAVSSYGLHFVPVFNTSLLREFFERRKLLMSDRQPFVFHPSIDIRRYTDLRRPRKTRRRIAVYGRPEVPRNLFPVAIEALQSFLSAERLTSGEVELISVGLVHPDVCIDEEHTLVSRGKIPWDEYPEFLSTVDVGLSLMYSPHPSHPPLEMAAAGAQVVTNRCETKDLGSLAKHIFSVNPTPDEVSLALSQAWSARAPSRAKRALDLSLLGPPMNEMLDDLSEHLNPVWQTLAETA